MNAFTWSSWILIVSCTFVLLIIPCKFSRIIVCVLSWFNMLMDLNKLFVEVTMTTTTGGVSSIVCGASVASRVTLLPGSREGWKLTGRVNFCTEKSGCCPGKPINGL